MTSEEYNNLSVTEQKKEDWMNAKWRPACGWMYISVCIFDFMIAPILWSAAQAIFRGGVDVQWQPLTLQGAGLFHLAMGAIIGVSAYGRTQEKLNGANNGGLQFSNNIGTTYIPPNSNAQSNINTRAQPVFSRSNYVGPTTYNQGYEPVSSHAPNVITGYGGRKAPMPAFDPEI